MASHHSKIIEKKNITFQTYLKSIKSKKEKKVPKNINRKEIMLEKNMSQVKHENRILKINTQERKA